MRPWRSNIFLSPRTAESYSRSWTCLLIGMSGTGRKPPSGAHGRLRYSTAVALDPASLPCLQNRARGSLRMHDRARATGSAIKASYRFALMKIHFGFTVAGDDPLLMPPEDRRAAPRKGPCIY